MIERGVFRHGSRKEKPHRKWWRKKRFLLPGLFLAYVAMASVESAFVDHLVARQMENYVNFEANFIDLKANYDINGNFLVDYEVIDDFGFTHKARFSGTATGNTVKYSYRRPRKYLSLIDALFYGSGKMYKVIVRIVDGNIVKL